MWKTNDVQPFPYGSETYTAKQLNGPSLEWKETDNNNQFIFFSDVKGINI